MTGFLDKLYFSVPVVLQNVLVSIYGFKLYRERYNPRADACLSALRKSERYSATEMRQLQERAFVELARAAITQVPHYREWARCEGVAANDIRSLDDLGRFPVLEKQVVRKDSVLFAPEQAHRKPGVFTLSTSGTSGTPLTVYCDPDSRTHHYAFFSRLRGWFGLDASSRRATLFGRIIMRPGDNAPPFWRYDVFQRNLLMSSYHLEPANLQAYYDQLVRYRPDEIIGYPSSLYQIAKHIVTAGLPKLRPKVLFCTAETLLDAQREMLERAFECPVIDQYGCTEMAFFASQCEHGIMHFHPEHGIIEVLNDDGEPCAPGEEGSLVVTGLVNASMPLIRYRIGDRVVLGEGPCACGRAFPVISKVVGRIDDVLLTPSGRPIGRLDPIFKGREGIFETQIIQLAQDLIRFNLVRDTHFDADAERDLLWEIQKRVGDDVRIELCYVDAIPKDKNGKFKAVIRAC